MKIEALDFFYFSMPHIEDIGDGSQDALLVRVSAGGEVGWGECEAAPLVTIASMVCPMSHSACKPVAASVLGQELNSPQDIARIHQQVRQNSMDLLQADHALSGIDIALWDLLGRKLEQPIYKLLGYDTAYPKTAYASMLFGATPQATFEKARAMAARGFRAIKFGWGAFGKAGLREDTELVEAAREGLGEGGILCIDAGAVWQTDLKNAEMRLEMLKAHGVLWLEEPFHTSALEMYQRLASTSSPVKLAGGEGSHNEYMAQHMISYGGVGYIQIDAGRVGGITAAQRVAAYADARNVRFVNHTFTSHLALSASLQAYAGLRDHDLCEYPVELKPLAYELTCEHLLPDADGRITLSQQPGLGLSPDTEALKKYLVDTQIVVNGSTLYRTPAL